MSMPGAADGKILHGQFAAGTRQHDRRRRRRRGGLADVAQARDALPRGDELLPAAERDFDRRQRASHHDRRRDHDAARGLVGHDEIGADTQHSRLQDVAQHFRAGAEIGVDVGRADIFLQIALVGLRPAGRQSIGHAKRANDLRIALRRVRQHLPLRVHLHRRLGRAARHPFGQHRHGNDRRGAEQRHEADQGVEQKQPDQKDRNPRHIEERRRPHARHEGAHLIEIAQRLLHQHRLHPAQRQGGERRMDRSLQRAVEQRGDPAEHPRAHRIEISLHDVGDQHHQRQAEQGREVTARNHAVVDLQHIDRA